MYKWLKLLSDNKPFIILLIGVFTSLSGNVGQYFQVQSKVKEKNTAVREVAVAFQNIIIKNQIPVLVEKRNAVTQQSEGGALIKKHVLHYH